MIVKADLQAGWNMVPPYECGTRYLSQLMLTDTQAKAQVIGVIPMMGIMFLPMFDVERCGIKV